MQKQVDEVTGVMRENIDVALQNQTKAEDLVDKTGLSLCPSVTALMWSSFQ